MKESAETTRRPMTGSLTVYTDGASRGNPGKSGAGILIVDDKMQVVANLNRYLGIRTNNEAEYEALIIGLEYLINHVSPAGFKQRHVAAADFKHDNNLSEIKEIHFLADSQLLVNQMNGVYSVKSPNIKPLYTKAKKLLKDLIEALNIKEENQSEVERNSSSANVKQNHVSPAGFKQGLPKVDFKYIPREFNKDADKFANLAIDASEG